MAALDLPAGVTIDGAIKPGFEKVLTKEAVAFVADLYGNKVKQGPAMPVKTRAELVKAYVTNEGLMKGEFFFGFLVFLVFDFFWF